MNAFLRTCGRNVSCQSLCIIRIVPFFSNAGMKQSIRNIWEAAPLGMKKKKKDMKEMEGNEGDEGEGDEG